MGSVTFLVKPASGLCGMRCRYCFYENVSQNRQVKSLGLMSPDTADALIRAGLSHAGPGDAEFPRNTHRAGGSGLAQDVDLYI